MLKKTTKILFVVGALVVCAAHAALCGWAVKSFWLGVVWFLTAFLVVWFSGLDRALVGKSAWRVIYRRIRAVLNKHEKLDNALTITSFILFCIIVPAALCMFLKPLWQSILASVALIMIWLFLWVNDSGGQIEQEGQFS